MSDELKTCKDYPEAGGCCPSCHEDWNEGYADPENIIDKDGNNASVCCDVYRWIEEQKNQALCSG